MSNKQIERSREARLWIGQVIIPAIGVGAMIFSKPEIRHKAIEKAKKMKETIKKKFKTEKTYL